VTYKTGFVLDDFFIAPYTFTQLETTGNYRAIAILHTFQFTVTHALGFSVFTSRILATDLSQSRCNSVDSTQLNSFAPKLISRQAGVLKLYSSLPISDLPNTSL
jgi:hypothetical protein